MKLIHEVNYHASNSPDDFGGNMFGITDLSVLFILNEISPEIPLLIYLDFYSDRFEGRKFENLPDMIKFEIRKMIKDYTPEIKTVRRILKNVEAGIFQKILLEKDNIF